MCAIAVSAVACVSVGAQSINVADYAELITSDQAASLDEKIQNVKRNHDNRYDIAVAAIDYAADMTDAEFEAEADDFYDYNNYGEGSDNSGVLLLVDMSGGEGKRHWHITTTGEAIYVFTDAGISYIGDIIVPMLANGDYYEAFCEFVAQCDDFMTQYDQKGEAYDSANLPTTHKDVLIFIAIALGGGLVVAFITVQCMKGKLKSVRSRAGAEEYVRDGSMNVTSSNELFLYNTVTRTKIAESNSSGGSSTHSGSSGTSHGGGGGSF